MEKGFFNSQALQLAIHEIDREPPSHSLARGASFYRLSATLIVASVGLFFIWYLKDGGPFTATVLALENWGVLPAGEASLLASQYSRLYAYVWWLLCHAVGYVLVPWVFIRWVLKEPMAAFGWRWAETTAHLRGYAVLLAVMLVGVVVVSFSQSFASFYPMYRLAERSAFDLLAWQVIYVLQFICLEFFFRGFLLHALRPAVGAGAIIIMCVPYMMIHFPKPMFESVVAFAFGVFAGMLALRSRSIWGGVIVHVCVAAAMDAAALWQNSAFPTNLWPLQFD